MQPAVSSTMVLLTLIGPDVAKVRAGNAFTDRGGLDWGARLDEGRSKGADHIDGQRVVKWLRKW
ncbi:hypothetical protein GJ744_008847 [Endocarpon pusillum]|uniref:Uncharacterized protein n=1 Tax=Endocarpon pusillum TaxID=364733 RepID=A0A8H7E9T6_9EURO|nr:hypothetical protein GJ744_008847 [Endocarpon pusillum]